MKRTICGRDIPAEEVERLVETGRTGLIDGLMSKRGTTFSAYFVLSGDKKKTEFEFPPR
jgi:DNA topoisomerase-3